MRAARLGAWGTAVLLAMSDVARAEGTGSQAAAQALFGDAKELWRAGKKAEACPKLEEVVRLEPQGNGARMMLAECLEDTGKLASAWATYLAAQSFADRAGQADRALRARARAEALAPRLSKLVVRVDPALLEIVDLKVMRDGETIGRAQWDTPIPVDGGVHKLEARARGRRTFHRDVTVRSEADVVTVEVPRDALADEAEPPAPPPVHSAAPPPTPAPSASIASPPAPPTTPAARWPLPVAIGGGVAVLIGAAFFVDQRRVESRQSELCGGDLKRCAATTPSYDPADDNARKERDFGVFVGLTGVGLTALGVAAYGAWGVTRVSAGPRSVAIGGVF